MNRDGDESQAVTTSALVRFVTKTRRGRRAAVTVMASAVVLGLLIGLLNSLLDLPQWVGYLLLSLLVSVTVPVLFRMVEAEDQAPPE